MQSIGRFLPFVFVQFQFRVESTELGDETAGDCLFMMFPHAVESLVCQIIDRRS